MTAPTPTDQKTAFTHAAGALPAVFVNSIATGADGSVIHLIFSETLFDQTIVPRVRLVMHVTALQGLLDALTKLAGPDAVAGGSPASVDPAFVCI